MKKPWERVARRERLERAYVFKRPPAYVEGSMEEFFHNGTADIECGVLYQMPGWGVMMTESVDVVLFDKNCKRVMTLPYENSPEWAAKLTPEGRALVLQLFACQVHVAKLAAQAVERRELDPNRPHVWIAKGNGFAFVRQRFREVAQLDAQARQEIIHRREHYVRGHWRTYRNGHRVWVHAHRRGDPSLGSLITVQSIEGVE